MSIEGPELNPVPLDELVPDLAHHGRLPDGRPWPPPPGAQPWSALWRKLAVALSNIDKGSADPIKDA
jgi:hypothetical protein